MELAPQGATSKIQPLDVAFNAELKKSVDRPHYGTLVHKPRVIYVSGKVSAGARHVLFTKWVSTA